MNRPYGLFGWMRQSLDGADWHLTYVENRQLREDGNLDCGTIASLAAAGYPTVPATVPGNMELDLYRAGVIEDPYFGVNPIRCQRLESLHLFYWRRFQAEPGDAGQETTLLFEGIDTVADIWLNGRKLESTDNMFIEQEIPADGLLNGENELVVHIRPAVIEARKAEPAPLYGALPYNFDALYLRKAASMFGWDIMPRFVSGGIWRSVWLVKKPKTRIDDLFCFTCGVDLAHQSASLGVWFSLKTDADSLAADTLTVEGVCGESRFTHTGRVWFTSGRYVVHVENCRFWWPGSSGAPDLYDVTATLSRGGKVIDQCTLRTGIRTVELERTSTTDAEGHGAFCFRINGRRIFAMGTNWVPLDAFHSNDQNRLPDILPMLTDLNCNIVRCWGGNVYESEGLFDYCDAHGIMIWQDFAMGCAICPQDEWFLQAIRKEATAIIRKYRNHPSLVLWAGDNECDCAYGWNGIHLDPNTNRITREVLPQVLQAQDFTRPYLPSSPYIDEEAFRTGRPTPEDHLWGPRDAFKGSYYRNTVAHFASETGYHGCPSVESLKRFLSEDQLWPWYDMVDGERQVRPEWLVHAAMMELNPHGEYAYRIGLMANQVKALFDCEPETLADFAAASQISQAEAKKYFIERFRLSKWRRTGIIWWNLIDGWPQISDAVVDYYGSRKLAYDYIKRSQQPVCLMFDEPDDEGFAALCAVNDTPHDAAITYRISDALTGETLCEAVGTAPADESRVLWRMHTAPDEQRFYRIEWTLPDGTTGQNHHMTGLKNVHLETYREALRRCGFRTV